MDPKQAMDDLKAIRQIMDRARRASGQGGGWIMVVWGCIWLIGFVAGQFLPEEVRGYPWLVLNPIGIAATIWLAMRSRAGKSDAYTSVWRPVVFWWVALGVFDVLLVWLLRLSAERDILLLILLTIALGYVQFGLFTHWAISGIGVLLAALTAGAALLIPDYFSLAVGVLGGGLLLGSGLWFVRSEK